MDLKKSSILHKELEEKKKVLLSGIQPSGRLHIGHYIGAVKNWIELQNEYDCLFMVADLHSLTSSIGKKKKIYENSLDIIAMYMAMGLDTEKNHIFLQSHVPQHTQLFWILNCNMNIVELMRMTQFKDKSKKKEDIINAGLLNYPILMASDILLYNTSVVPTGADQKQHIELTRNLAISFNKQYGETFVVPEPYISDQGNRIMSLVDPTKKMSKSDSNQNGCIFLTDELDDIRKKIYCSITDSYGYISFDVEKQSGISNMILIMAYLLKTDVEEIVLQYQNSSYKVLKDSLIEILIETIEPIKKRFLYIRNDVDMINKIIDSGKEYAINIAKKTVENVYLKIGLIERNNG